jgi:hypothetical protein
MTNPRDAAPAPESPLFSSTPRNATQLAKESDPASLYQEINERRARVENAELLQHLRGL